VRFLAPSFFALAAALIPPLVLLYFLKLKRQPILVPSTLLWRHAIEDIRVNAPFRWFRNNLLLILQFLALAGLIWALVRPAVNARMDGGMTYILLVDNSASMGATDEPGGRLARAKEEAGKLIDGMQAGDRAMIMSFADKTSIVCAFTSNKSLLKERLKGIRIRDTRTEFTEALKITRGYAERAAKPPVVYVLSDGRLGAAGDTELEAAEVRFVRLGQGGNNIGITGFNASPSFTRPDTLQVFVRINNFANEEVATVCELTAEDRIVDAKSVTMPPGGSVACLFEIRGFSQGVLTAHLGWEDDLAVDNTAWTVVEERPPLRVLLVTAGNLFLQRVLETPGSIELSSISPGEFQPPEGPPLDTSEFDLVVFDCFAPSELPSAAALFIGDVPRYGGLAQGGECENPVVLDWDRVHPLMLYAGFDDLRVSKALRVTPSEQSSVLMWGDEGPLMLAEPRGELTDVIIAFDILESDWPLRVSFPVFFDNLLRFYCDLASAGAGSLATGGIIRIPLPESGGGVSVVDPDGKEHAVPPSGESVAVFSQTARAGVYSVIAEGAAGTKYALNLLHAAESDIAPAETLEVGYRKVAGTGRVVAENRELWKLFAFLALGVVMVEWAVFNRKIAV